MGWSRRAVIVGLVPLPAHGGTAGLLVEALFLGVPAALFGLFILVSRRRSQHDEANQPAAEPEADDCGGAEDAPPTSLSS